MKNTVKFQWFVYKLISMHVFFICLDVITYHMQITKYGLQLKLLNFVLSSDQQTYGFLTYFSPMFHFYTP